MIESQQEELFIEPKSTLLPKLLAAGAALLITALVFAGYTLLRKRHAQESGSLASSSQPAAEPRQPPKALVMVDEPILQGNKTIISGTVKNTSKEKLEGLSVELELKRRQGGAAETQLVALQPAQLEPEQEARYSVELKAQDYSLTRLIGLKSNQAAVAYTAAPGQKRPAERLEPKTVIVKKRSSGKPDEFLNTADNPARVP